MEIVERRYPKIYATGGFVEVDCNGTSKGLKARYFTTPNTTLSHFFACDQSMQLTETLQYQSISIQSSERQGALIKFIKVCSQHNAGHVVAFVLRSFLFHYYSLNVN